MQIRSFPNDVVIPDGFPHPRDNELTVKAVVWVKLLRLQEYHCPVCTHPLVEPIDMHEALVSKGDVQGWPKSWKVIIFNIFNCVLIHRHCHEEWPSREEMWKYKCTLFKEDEIKKWYYSLPFKRKVQHLCQ